VTVKALRAIAVRLWGLAWVRWGLGIMGAIALLAVAWRLYVRDRAIMADALSRTQAALAAANVARSAAEADVEFYRAQVAAAEAAYEHPATAIECEGVLSWTTSENGTKVWRCEGKATASSTPVLPPPIVPGEATAGMGAAAGAAVAAAAAGPSLERLAVVIGPGIHSLGEPALAGVAGVEVRLVGSMWVVVLVTVGREVSGQIAVGPYLGLRYAFR
jgi:hypothetical protein